MSYTSILGVYHLATMEEGYEGALWYVKARTIARKIAGKYGVSLMVAVGVIAALSPRNKWHRNVTDAENFIKVWAADPKSLDSVKVCTFPANKAKAKKILLQAESEQEILNILSGPKLQEFFRCIMGCEDEVCIDGHAYSVWLGDRVTTQDTPKIGVKLRKQIKADYQQAAKLAGIPAYAMQAITWLVWRRLHGVG